MIKLARLPLLMLSSVQDIKGNQKLSEKLHMTIFTKDFESKSLI